MGSSSKLLVAMAFGVLLLASDMAYCQDDDNDDGSTPSTVPSTINNDIDDIDDDDSIGASPLGSAPGCISPWAYLDGKSGLSLFADALDAADLKDRLKNRNVTGTILAPTNAAFGNLSQITGLSLGDIDDDLELLLRSVLEYHILFAALPPANLTTLGNGSYETALSLGAGGTNARASANAREILTRQPGFTYQNVTVFGGPVPAGSIAAVSPIGTFRVIGANNTANIIYNATIQPFSTCSATIYRIDQVLLPPGTLASLGTATPVASSTSTSTDTISTAGGDDDDEGDSDDGK